MRAQFENDPMVKSMLQRFGGRISECGGVKMNEVALKGEALKIMGSQRLSNRCFGGCGRCRKTCSGK